MTLPALHPHHGLAKKYTDAMRTHGAGAAPHTSKESPFDSADLDASESVLSKRLAKKKERLKELRREVAELEKEKREAETEVERMRQRIRRALSALEGSLLLPDGTDAKDVLRGALDGAEWPGGYKQAAIKAMGQLFKCDSDMGPHAETARMILKRQFQTEYTSPNSAIKDVLRGTEVDQDG